MSYRAVGHDSRLVGLPVIIVRFGEAFFGPAHRWAGAHVVTRFFFLWFVPLIPTASHFAYPDGAGALVSFPIRMDARSVASCLVAWWGGLACLAAGVTAVLDGAGGQIVSATVWGVAAVAGGVVIVFARTRLLAEPAAARRRRVLGLDVLGVPVDPLWLLPTDARRERDRWSAWLEARLPTLTSGYRTVPTDALEAALDAEPEAVEFVKVAAVVAMLDRTLGSRGAWQPLVDRLAVIDPRLAARIAADGVIDAEPVSAVQVVAPPVEAKPHAPSSSPALDPSGVHSRMPEALAAGEITRNALTSRAGGLAAVVAGGLCRIYAEDIVGSFRLTHLLSAWSVETQLVRFGADWLIAFGAVFAVVGVPREPLRWRRTPESFLVAAALVGAFVAVASACWRLLA